jgi:hypothetical protein
MRKSVSLGMTPDWNTSWPTTEPCGWGTPRAQTSAMPSPAWNIISLPDAPAASRLMKARMCRVHGWPLCTNECEPCRMVSSAPLNTNSKPYGGSSGRAAMARMISTKMATLAALSLAPGTPTAES